jgi:hypothetical protein
MGMGFYIPTDLHHPIHTIIPMGDMAEVFNVELQAIYECLWICYYHRHQDRLCCCQIHIFIDK